MHRLVRTETAICKAIEIAVLAALRLLLAIVVLVATGMAWFFLFTGIRAEMGQVATAAEMLPLLQQTFGAVLSVVLGLELLETLGSYSEDHQVRVEVILIVAIIAVGRHVIRLDFEHTAGSTLAGLSGVTIALTLGYFLVVRAREPLQATLPHSGENA